MNGDVFLVDDNPANLALLAGILRAEGYKVRMANSGRSALEVVRGRPPDVILLDITMPEMDGYDVCRALKADPATRAIPVLFISALDDTLDKVKAFQIGGVDYIPKPFQVEEVLARVKNHLEIGRLQEQLRARNAELAAHVAEIESLNQQLREQAIRDPLTNLHNRRYFEETIARDAARAIRSDEPLAILMIDIDHFKRVNDAHGHAIGDRVLQRLAGVLCEDARDADLVCRFGGEEFIVALPGATQAAALERAERLRRRCTEPGIDTAAGVDIRCTLSVGVAMFRGSEEVIETTLLRADAAMYEAKRSGRDRVVAAAATLAAADGPR